MEHWNSDEDHRDISRDAVRAQVMLLAGFVLAAVIFVGGGIGAAIHLI